MAGVKIIENKTQWNNFLLNQPTQTGIFLQSAEWLDFQETMGHKTHRLGVVENNQITALCGIVENDLPLNKKYFYIPRGPILNQKSETKNQELLKKILEIAKKEKAIFLRIEPIYQNLKSEILNLKFKKVTPVQPERTLVMNLTKSEDDLLTGMYPKTRYNIRLAKRHGVTVHRTRLTDPEMLKNDFEIFWQLLSKTAKRDGFKPHPKNYYWQMLKTLVPRPSNVPSANATLYFAKYQNKTLAANLIMFFGDTATYLHGASSDAHRNIMAPHFLHWHIICEAKRLGFKYYDFWGIDETKWPGITRFKKGFTSEASPNRSVKSGHIINYPGTFDLPISKFWYKIYCLAKKFM